MSENNDSDLTKIPGIGKITAKKLKLPVFAGPVEATAIGNILVQMMSLGDIENIKQGRKLIKEVYKIKEY